MPSTLYFAYGSNLCLNQMSIRCPSSTYLGLAKLSHWRWIINNRGYANVVHSPTDEVWGIIYTLPKVDEEKLDVFEGVMAEAYEKQILALEIWREVEEKYEDVEHQGEKELALCYVSKRWVDEARPKEEYVHRMNMAISDGLKKGIPVAYVEKYMRPFIPGERSE